MGGVAARAALDRGIEAALRRDRWVIGATLIVVVALSWLYLWHDAAAMQAASDAVSITPYPISVALFVLTFLMWTIMMVGMMLPSAAPAVLLYGTLVRKNGERGTILPAVWVFVGGYLTAWTVFSLLATVLQIALDQARLLTPMMVSASNTLDAAILIAAGIYQWLPVKEVCLRKCRAPLQFLLMRWSAGAFRMGVEHGLYCVGCCWVLMLLLFVAGVMDLLWVALITGFVLIEKLLPGARWTGRIAGIGIGLIGVYLLVLHA